jgi:hypothetical protein
MNRLFLPLVLAVLAACGGPEVPSPTIPKVLGTWRMPEQTTTNPGGTQSVSFVLAFTIEEGRFSVTNTCTSSRGRALSASVSVPARLSADALEVKASASRKLADDGLNCSVTVEASTFTWAVAGETLTLSAPGEAPVVLTRR